MIPIFESGSRGTLFWGTIGALAAIGGFSLWLTAAALFQDPTPTQALATPRFLEENVIGHVYDGEFEFFVGGGVAVFDCDHDLRPDLFLAGGSNRSALFRNLSSVGGTLEFSLVEDDATRLPGVTGAYPLDVDSDRITDLAVLRFGENLLLRGRGDCQFEQANDTWGVDGGDEWTVGFSARWDAGETLPILAFANYVDIEGRASQDFACSDNVLIRPDGHRYGSPETLSPGWCSLSMLFSDWDRSGSRDLRVTNDKHYYRQTQGEEQLWTVEQGDPPRLYTREEGWEKLQIWGMGIASQDVTGDGLPEIYLTSQGDNKLQTLAGESIRPSYEDIAIRRGVTAHRPFSGDDIHPSTAWHPEFEDVNNDGFLDLYISKGNVEAQSDHAMEDPNNLLIGQSDGTFLEGAAEAGIMNVMRTRGAALVDLNLDGMLDLVEVNRRENVTVWRNLGKGTPESPEAIGNWAAVMITQPPPNNDAVGSWLEVRIGERMLSREVTIGGGHAGGQLGWLHFGLGHTDQMDIRVQWPDGEIGPWLTVEADSFVIIKRDNTEPQPWTPSLD